MTVKRLLLLFVCNLYFFLLSAGGYTITTFDYSWVTASYPTSYQTGSFSLNGTDADSFEKNKSNVTFIVDLPAGFEFNTSAASDTVVSTGSGNVNTITFAYTSTTRLTVTYSTLNSNLQDTLFFNNIEIRATASGSSGTMVRNGGTARIKGASGGPSSGQPTSLEPFGTFSAHEQMVYTSSAVTQTETSDVSQYSSNNEALRIEVVMTNEGGALDLTQFSLDTDGGNGTGTDDPSNDLTNVKVWATGASSTFATTNLFGSYGSAPNGTFNITGSYTLSAGSNYFWVTFDVAGGANTTNSIDFSVDGITIDGTNHTDQTTPTPTGKRDITAATFYYAIADGNWTSTSVWSSTDNGSSCSCSPNGSGVVIIDTNYNITLNATRTIDVLEVHQGGDVTGSNDLTINNSLFTYSSGYFSISGDLVVTNNIALTGTGSSNVSDLLDIGGDLNIGSGTTLTHSGNGAGAGAGRNVYVGGNLVIDGTLSQTGGGDIFLDGGDLQISGSGSLTNTSTNTKISIDSGNKTILSGSNLTINCEFEIDGAYTVTNNGTITLNTGLTGTNANSVWTQGSSSVLNISGELLTTGVLNPSATGNVVNYNDNVAQNVKVPASSYYDLLFNGAATKTLLGSINVINDLTISASSTLDVSASNYDITLQGDWIQNGSFTDQAGKVTFNGTIGNQSIQGSASPVFNKLEINKSADDVVLSTGLFINSRIIMSAGDLDLNGNNILLTSTAFVSGETNDKRIFGTSGEISITLTINTPSSLNPGNLGVIFTSSDNFGTTTIARGHQVQTGGGNESIYRYFDISPTNNSGLNVTMVFNYFENELNGQDENGLILWRSIDGGSTWSNEGGIVNTTTNTITLTGITAFSKWAGSNGNSNPLPVELVYFKGNCDNGEVTLEWLTASEVNVDGFELYHSKDGYNYEWDASIYSEGSEGSQAFYSLKEVSEYSGVNYYQLLERDFSGRLEPIALEVVTCNEQQESQGFDIIHKESFISIENINGFENIVLLSVYDLRGRLVFSQRFEAMDEFIQIPSELLLEGYLIFNLKDTSGTELSTNYFISR